MDFSYVLTGNYDEGFGRQRHSALWINKEGTPGKGRSLKSWLYTSVNVHYLQQKIFILLTGDVYEYYKK